MATVTAITHQIKPNQIKYCRYCRCDGMGWDGMGCSHDKETALFLSSIFYKAVSLLGEEQSMVTAVGLTSRRDQIYMWGDTQILEATGEGRRPWPGTTLGRPGASRTNLSIKKVARL